MNDRRNLGGVRRRRGAATILLTVVLLVLIAAGTSSYLLLVATRARQSAYERNAIQALYAAEAGVEVALATLAGSDGARELEGSCGNGRWAARALVDGRRAGIESVGHVTPRLGAPVARRLIVAARRSGDRWRVETWRRVPLTAAQTPREKPSPALREGMGED